MGFLKKIFKPVSKVLDKIVPNEIKPALPYLAAHLYFGPPGLMGIGESMKSIVIFRVNKYWCTTCTRR